MIIDNEIQCKATKDKPYCSSCGCGHFQYDDGFDYLDCMAHYRAVHEPKEVKEARESKVEVWDAVNKQWNKKVVS